MKCNLDKPTACFSCPYEECKDNGNYAPNRKECEWLYQIIPESKEHRHDRRREEKDA